MLVCPECGNGTFEATLTTRTEYTYEVFDDGGLCERESTVVDGGDEGDIETLACADCGGDFNPDELVTEAVYATEVAFGDVL
jgi:hypothetical protein